MLGGDVPWEGSSRRVVSLQAPCHVKSTCVHGDKVQPSCLRETKSRLPRCAIRLPHACGGSAPRGWIEPQ